MWGRWDVVSDYSESFGSRKTVSSPSNSKHSVSTEVLDLNSHGGIENPCKESTNMTHTSSLRLARRKLLLFMGGIYKISILGVIGCYFTLRCSRHHREYLSAIWIQPIAYRHRLQGTKQLIKENTRFLKQSFLCLNSEYAKLWKLNQQRKRLPPWKAVSKQTKPKEREYIYSQQLKDNFISVGCLAQAGPGSKSSSVNTQKG